MIELPRRKFLAGLVGLIAAPAIVRAASIMPVRSYDTARGIIFADQRIIRVIDGRIGYINIVNEGAGYTTPPDINIINELEACMPPAHVSREVFQLYMSSPALREILATSSSSQRARLASHKLPDPAV